MGLYFYIFLPEQGKKLSSICSAESCRKVAAGSFCCLAYDRSNVKDDLQERSRSSLSWLSGLVESKLQVLNWVLQPLQCNSRAVGYDTGIFRPTTITVHSTATAPSSDHNL